MIGHFWEDFTFKSIGIPWYTLPVIFQIIFSSSTCNLRCLDCAAYKNMWPLVSGSRFHSLPRTTAPRSCTQSRHETSQLESAESFQCASTIFFGALKTQNHAVHKDSCRSPPTWICGESQKSTFLNSSQLWREGREWFFGTPHVHLKENIESMDFIHHHREKCRTTFPTHQQKKKHWSGCWCLCQF